VDLFALASLSDATKIGLFLLSCIAKWSQDFCHKFTVTSTFIKCCQKIPGSVTVDLLALASLSDATQIGLLLWSCIAKGSQGKYIQALSRRLKGAFTLKIHCKNACGSTCLSFLQRCNTNKVVYIVLHRQRKPSQVHPLSLSRAFLCSCSQVLMHL
jgi:hypothetical protein